MDDGPNRLRSHRRFSRCPAEWMRSAGNKNGIEQPPLRAQLHPFGWSANVV